MAGFIEIGHAPVLAEILGQAARAQDDPIAASIRADLGQGLPSASSAPQLRGEVDSVPELALVLGASEARTQKIQLLKISVGPRRLRDAVFER